MYVSVCFCLFKLFDISLVFFLSCCKIILSCFFSIICLFFYRISISSESAGNNLSAYCFAFAVYLFSLLHFYALKQTWTQFWLNCFLFVLCFKKKQIWIYNLYFSSVSSILFWYWFFAHFSNYVLWSVFVVLWIELSMKIWWYLWCK